MKKIKVVIEDVSDSDDVFPTCTPWWYKDRCLLIGCSLNQDLKCLGKSGCELELPKQIDCRFKLEE